MCSLSRSDCGDFIRLLLQKLGFLPFSRKLDEVMAGVAGGLFQRKVPHGRGHCLCPFAPVTTEDAVVPSPLWLCLWGRGCG